MKKLLIILTILSVLTSCSNQVSNNPNDYLVKVNGEIINQSMFDTELAVTLRLLENQGHTITEEMTPLIEEEVLNMMIRSTILIQEATQRNYIVQDEEIDSIYQLYVSNFETEENLLNMLSLQNMTIEEFKAELKNQLLIDSFISDYVEENGLSYRLHITDDEINAEFEAFKQMSGHLDLDLNDYYMAIKSSLEEERLTELLVYIEDLLLEESEIIYNE